MGGRFPVRRGWQEEVLTPPRYPSSLRMLKRFSGLL